MVAFLDLPLLTLGRIPPNIIDVVSSPIGQSTLHPYVIGLAINRCPAAVEFARARAPFLVSSLIGSTVSAKQWPRGVMEVVCCLLLWHVCELIVVRAGTLKLTRTARATFLCRQQSNRQWNYHLLGQHLWRNPITGKRMKRKRYLLIKNKCRKFSLIAIVHTKTLFNEAEESIALIPCMCVILLYN